MNYKSIIISILLVFVAIEGFTADDNTFHPDTIRMQMTNGTTIECRTTYDGKHNLETNLNIKNQINLFLKRWAVLGIEELNQNKPVLITCSQVKEYSIVIEDVIDIENTKSNIRVIFPVDSNVALMIKGRNKVELNSNLAIYFDKIEQLRELMTLNFPEVLKNIDQQIGKTPMSTLKEVPFVAWLKVDKNNTAELSYQKNTFSFNKDQILFTGGGGITYVNQAWNGSVCADMVFQLGEKMISTQSFTIGYEWMYDLTSGEKDNGHWINLGYSRNYSRNPKKPRWFGLTLSHLIINNNSDAFYERTFRVGLNHRFHKHLSLEPQLYFDAAFLDVNLGLKLKIHL